jgi:hypothetical protein
MEKRWVLFFEHDPVTAAGRLKTSDRGIVFDAPVEVEG